MIIQGQDVVFDKEIQQLDPPTTCEDLMPGDFGTPQQPSNQPKRVKQAK